MEENSILDDNQSRRHLQRPPGSTIRQGSIPAPDVFHHHQFHDERCNNVDVDDCDDDDDDDDFVCNPSPHIRAPAVIVIPASKICDRPDTNKCRLKGCIKRRPRRYKNDGSFPTAADYNVHEDNIWEYALRLLSNIIFWYPRACP
jgi:hypothetical protein